MIELDGGVSLTLIWQTAAVDELTVKRFQDLETVIWDALANGDREADLQMLTEDFVGVYPSGFAARADHADQLLGGPSIAAFEIEEGRILVIGASAVMFSYRASFVRYGLSSPEAMYVSSLWVERDGQWRNVFSQDTPV